MKKSTKKWLTYGAIAVGAYFVYTNFLSGMGAPSSVNGLGRGNWRWRRRVIMQIKPPPNSQAYSGYQYSGYLPDVGTTATAPQVLTSGATFGEYATY